MSELKTWEKIVSKQSVERKSGHNYYVNSDGAVIEVDSKNADYIKHRKEKAKDKRKKANIKVSKLADKKAKVKAKKQVKIERLKEKLKIAEKNL